MKVRPEFKGINWKSYKDIKAISENEFKLINEIEYIGFKNVAEVACVEDPRDFISLFINISKNIFDDDTLFATLSLLESLLKIQPKFLKAFHSAFYDKNAIDVYSVFLQLIKKTDAEIVEKSYSILSCLLEVEYEENLHKKVEDEKDDGMKNKRVQLIGYEEKLLNDIVIQFTKTSDSEIRVASAIRALMILLKKPKNRDFFLDLGGQKHLVEFIKVYYFNVQLLYEIVMCIWLLSFNEKKLKEFEGGILSARLHYILKNTKKEKIIRIVAKILKNFLREQKIVNGMIMVGIPKTLISLTTTSFKDKDITKLFGELSEKLENYIDELSSFEEYYQEVLSGVLDWTPVHTSEKFWRGNVLKFDQENFKILRELGKYLSAQEGDFTQQTLKNQSVAVHDFGQFVQFHPQGKSIIEDLDLKTKIIMLMEHKSEEVKKHALECTQKLLVKKWEYLQ